MELINEKYILMFLEYKDTRKNSIDELLVALTGDSEFGDVINDNRKSKDSELITFSNVPEGINKEFVAYMREKGEELDPTTKYLYPINFSLIKRIVHTYEGKSIHTHEGIKKDINRWRITNKSPGIMMLYKYMGPIFHFSEFAKVVKEKIESWKKDKKNIFFNFEVINYILCAEIDYLTEIINHKYFIVCFDFQTDKKADPNDFRRPLLGITRDHKSLDEFGRYGFPKIIKDKFQEEIKIDADTILAYPIDFSIIRRPVVLYSDEKNGKKKHKISQKASGVMTAYKYMGPILQVEKFRTIFKKVLTGSIVSNRSLFDKSDDPLILIGADIEMYDGF